jgi:hypothetical protein
MPPPVASACKPLNLAVGEQLAYADMICTAVQTCQDVRIGQVPFAPPNPVVEQGKRYYVVRGDLWGIPGNVVVWPEGGVPFPGFAGGAFFASRCFAAPPSPWWANAADEPGGNDRARNGTKRLHD